MRAISPPNILFILIILISNLTLTLQSPGLLGIFKPQPAEPRKLFYRGPLWAWRVGYGTNPEEFVVCLDKAAGIATITRIPCGVFEILLPAKEDGGTAGCGFPDFSLRFELTRKPDIILRELSGFEGPVNCATGRFLLELQCGRGIRGDSRLVI